MLFPLIFLVLLLIYLLVQYNNGHWTRKRIPGPPPEIFVGNIKATFFKTRSVGQIFADVYKKYDRLPFVGVFRALTPCLLIREPEFIKNITVKDFRSFYNNDFQVDKKTDPIFGRNPFVLKGEEWKSTRSQLTPCFTSGKMKTVFPLVDEVCRKLMKYLDNNQDACNSVGLEAKALCSKYTLENVASCAFGVEGNSFTDPNAEFMELAKQFVAPESINGLKTILIGLFPKLSNILSVKFVTKQVEDKLESIVADTITYRETNNLIRNDFLQMMRQIQKNAKPGTFTHTDLTAHASTFFVDGYETSAVAMSLVLYAIATHPDIQEKIRNEIETVLEEHNNIISYESIYNMKYLEASIDESLRLYPPLFIYGKISQQKYTYSTVNKDDFEDMTVTLNRGDTVLIPVGGIHFDPKYYPEPETFKPERFLGENKESIQKHLYLPFGYGPRTCLGQRFGVLQIKMAIAYLLRSYKIKLNKKTQEPLKFDPWYFLHAPIGGVWLDFERVKN